MMVAGRRDRLRGRRGSSCSTASRSSLPTDARVAVIGGSGSGKDVLGQVLARLALPTGGSIKLDGDDFLQLSRIRLGARTPISARKPTCSRCRCATTCCSACSTRSPARLRRARRRADPRSDSRREAERAGNPAARPDADWSTTSWRAPPARTTRLPLHGAGAEDRRAGRGHLSPRPARRDRRQHAHPDLAEKTSRRGTSCTGGCRTPPMPGLVEPFKSTSTTRTCRSPRTCCSARRSARTSTATTSPPIPYMQTVLKEGLDGTCSQWACSIAETMVELFSGLSPDNPAVRAVQLHLGRRAAATSRLPCSGWAARAPTRAVRPRPLQADPAGLRYIEARHRLGLIDAAMEDAPARGAARLRAMPAAPQYAGDIEFYDSERYNGAGALQRQHPVRPRRVRHRRRRDASRAKWCAMWWPNCGLESEIYPHRPRLPGRPRRQAVVRQPAQRRRSRAASSGDRTSSSSTDAMAGIPAPTRREIIEPAARGDCEGAYADDRDVRRSRAEAGFDIVLNFEDGVTVEGAGAERPDARR